jgi:CRISPR/Cas system-associated endoribonuclease Cas2
MKKIMMGFLMFISMAFASTSTNAQSRFSQQNQKQHIQQGVVHGRLTKNEARQLRMEQARISSMKKMAMSDGYISPKEKVMIATAERRANRNIYYQKHDRQQRF